MGVMMRNFLTKIRDWLDGIGFEVVEERSVSEMFERSVGRVGQTVRSKELVIEENVIDLESKSEGVRLLVKEEEEEKREEKRGGGLVKKREKEGGLEREMDLGSKLEESRKERYEK